MAKASARNFSIFKSIDSAFGLVTSNFLKISGYFIVYWLILNVFDYMVSNGLRRLSSDSDLLKALDFVLSNLIGGALYLGFAKFLLDLIRKKKTDMSVLFQYFNKHMIHLFMISVVVTAIGIMLKAGLIHHSIFLSKIGFTIEQIDLYQALFLEHYYFSLGELLPEKHFNDWRFVVAMVFLLALVLKFSFVGYFIADKKMNAMQAVKASFELTSSFRVLVKLCVAWIPLVVLSIFMIIFSLGLAIFVIMPLFDSFFAIVYTKLTKSS